MNCSHSVRWALGAVLFAAVFSCPSFAEHRDPAPLPEEVAQKVITRMHGVPNALPQILRRHLDETEQLLENETRGERLSKDSMQQRSSRAMLLRGKLHEFEAMRVEIRAELNRMRGRVEQRGLTQQARALDDLRAKIENRFDRLTTALAVLRDASDAHGRAAALVNARQLMKELHGRVRERELELDTPQPTFRMERPSPGPTPLASPVPPAYLSGPAGPGSNMFAALGDSLLAAVVPPTPPEAQSCYTSGNVDAADLAENMEVVLTPEIRSLAEKLGYSPARILEYVSNEIRFEPYYGSLKGAVGTLYSKAGGPTDQASLLIALLRASNIPARYVRGTIQVKDATDMGANGRGPRWIGAKSYKAAAYMLANGRFPSLGYGPGVLQFGHVWVEACVPYDNYRGARVDNTGHRWIPLDPSFKDKTYQAGIAGALTNVPFDYQNYMAKRGNDLVHEQYEKQVEAWVQTQQPLYANNTIEDVGYTGTQRPQRFDILPASLPYVVVQFTSWDTGLTAEIAEVPTIHRYKFSIVVKNNAGTALATHTTWLPQMALQRVTLSYKGADASQQAALDSWINDGNPDSALPCTINVAPVIKVESATQATGTGSVGLCTTDNILDMELTVAERDGNCAATPLPIGCINKTVYKNIGAANYHALQAYAFQASDRLLAERAERLISKVRATPDPNAGSNMEEIEGEFLHIAGLKYMRYITDAGKRIGELMGNSGESGNHIGLTSGQMKVQYIFDLPFAVYRHGLLVDVLGGQSRGVDLSTGQGVWEPFLLSSYSSSLYESYIWMENARMDAVSTVRGVQYARESNIEVLTLNTANWAAESPKLTSNTDPAMDYFPAQLNQIKTSYIDQGYTLTIPRSLIQYEDWKGAVYAAELNNLATTGTAMAGFIISKAGGGYTVGPPISYNYSPILTTGYFFSSPPPPTSTTTYTAPPAILSSAINFGCGIYCTSSGDPVNMVTGNMYHTERDISIKGRGGLPIVFERSYNSREAKDGPLGFGWTHSFNHYLVFKDDNANGESDSGDTDNITSSVTWVDGTGSEKFIQVTGTGSGVAISSPFTAPQGFFFQTTRNTDGTYSIREKNGLTYTFESVAGTEDQKAKLLSISDRNGNTLTMGYTGSNLTSVTDGLNRSLTFTYDVNNRIVGIIDWSGRMYQYVYDTNGNLVTYKNPLAVTGGQPPVTYDYYTATYGANLNHAMKKYTLPRGNGMSFEYYMNGRVFRHYNTLGETMTFTYNDFRRETVSVNERGFERRFFFDKHGNPVKIVEENGATREYIYDPANPFNRLTKRGPMGYVTNYQYDASGNVTRVTNPSTNTVEYSYFNSFNQPGKIKDARGNYRILKYDAKGNVLQEIKLKSGYGATTDPATYTPVGSQTAAWTINTNDTYGNALTSKRVLYIAEQAGPTIEYNYNDTVNGIVGLNAVTITRRGDKDGSGTISASEFDTANLTYDALGRVTTGIDADWHTKQYFYDSLDRVTRATDAVGNLRDYVYDQNGNAAGESLTMSVNGAPTQQDSSAMSYDSSDRRQLALDAAGNAMRYEYDASGNVVQITNPDNYSLSFEYDAGNHVTKASDRENNAVTRTLDLDGKPRTITDPNGNTVKYEYYGPEQDGRLKTQRDALNRATTYEYDANGNVISVTDNLGRTTLTNYDELNRPWRVVQPVFTHATLGPTRPVIKYTYNTLGYLTAVTAGRTVDLSGVWSPTSDIVGTQMTYIHDDFGRKLKETDPLGKFWTFEYDLNNNLTKATDAKGQLTQYTWGHGHQLQTLTDYNGNITYYTRNALGQPITVQSPAVSYNHAYDEAHRLKSVTDSRGNKTLTYAYSPGGLLNSMTDSDGNRTDYVYDPVGRLAGLWTPKGDVMAYVYDPAGRLTEKWMPNGVKTRYQYNADNTLSQLVNQNPSGGIVSQHDYTYDGVGNRQTHVELINGTTTPYKYVYDELNRLKEVRNNSTNALIAGYNHDWLDRRETQTDAGGTRYYLHDAGKRLLEIRTGSPTGTLVAGLVYDNNGNLTKKCEGGTVTRSDTACAGTTVTTLTYNALDQLAQATRTNLAPETYVYDPEGRRIQKTGSATTNYLYNGPDITAEYGANWTTANATYTHGPAWDDPILRSTSTTTQYYHQDGLGSVVAVTDATGATVGSARYDAWGNKLASTGTIPQYGYTGREPDGTGLIHYRARTYDPTTGTFTQRDPLGFHDGVNLYAYVGNNPINNTDPTGELCVPCVFAAGGGAVGLAIQGYQDIRAGNLSSFGTYAGAATSGAIGGLALMSPGGLGTAVRYGAGAAFAGNNIQQGIDIATGAQNVYNPASAVTATLGGGTAAGVLKPFAGVLTPGYASTAQGLLTKYANGTISQVAPQTAFKMVPSMMVKENTIPEELLSNTLTNTANQFFSSPSTNTSPSTQSLPSFTALPPSNTFSNSICSTCFGSYSSGGSGTPRSK